MPGREKVELQRTSGTRVAAHGGRSAGDVDGGSQEIYSVSIDVERSIHVAGGSGLVI